MTNKTENGIYYTHGSFLSNGWSNTGLWVLEFDVLAPSWKYTGIMFLCSEEINPYTDAKHASYAMCSWEGVTYPGGASTVISEDSMSKITSTNVWHHVRIEKQSTTQFKTTINNTYNSIRNNVNLPNWSILHLGSRDNPSERNYGGVLQFKNIRVKPL